METNFAFLEEEFPILYNIACGAEYNLHNDPVTALFKLRQFTEKAISYIIETHHIGSPAENSLHNRIIKQLNVRPNTIIVGWEDGSLSTKENGVLERYEVGNE